MSIVAQYKRIDRMLLVIFLMAFALRVGSQLVFVGLNTAPPPGSDDVEFDLIAKNLAEGNGYRGFSPDVVNDDGTLREHPTAYRPPVTPLIYAAMYKLFGHRFLIARVSNSFLGSITVVLVYLIANRMFGRTAARLAAAAYAFYPLAVYYNLSLDSETHGAFLVCLFVWSTIAFGNSRDWRSAARAGVALGVLLLCKPGFVFVIPLLAIWGWVVCRLNLFLWLRAGPILVFTGLTILPWVARNYHEFATLIPFGNSGGSLLLQANNRIVVDDQRYFGYAVWDTSLPEYASELRAPNDEVKRDAVAKRIAIQWLKDNPDKWFYLARGKFYRLWTPEYFGHSNRELALGVSVYYALILCCFMISAIPIGCALWRSRDPGFIIFIPILATVLMAVIFHGQHRYRFPIDSLCIVAAAGGVKCLIGVIAGRKIRDTMSVGKSSRRVLVLLALSACCAASLFAASAIDNRRIDEYRDDINRKQIAAIHSAVLTYQARTGTLPTRLADLVPDYIPTAEGLHCPTHSLEYSDYQLLQLATPSAAVSVTSYEIRPTPGTNGQFQIVQIRGSPTTRDP